MFPPETRLAAGDTLVLSSQRDVARGLFPRLPVLGDLFFEIAPGDTMKLLDPALATLGARVKPDLHHHRSTLPDDGDQRDQLPFPGGAGYGGLGRAVQSG